jgi:hypothetical protein
MFKIENKKDLDFVGPLHLNSNQGGFLYPEINPIKLL